MTSILELFTINLNDKAKKNLIDPVVGRQKELTKLTSILLKRTKNNPILLGSAGVGKTAIVEELARSIVNETCHHELLDKQIFMLDTTSLVSGTNERGSLEERTTMILDEITKRDDVILLIDEIHTLVGKSVPNSSTRSAHASLDIANMLKPSLSRGLIRCIGATTLDEYNKFFLNDKALDRRFQPIQVDEPSPETTREILLSIKPYYEKYHSCVITKDAINKCVELANRYLYYRNFPDKAIDLMDESCSRLNIGRKYKNRNDNVLNERDVEEVLMQFVMDPISFDTDNKKIVMLEESLKDKIIGQDQTIDIIINTLKRNICGFKNPNRPISSMLFLGPTGTGKTETVNLIADHYYGSRHKNIIRFDMSEYMEPHTVSSLIGSPPGYVGFEEGGKLTNMIKRNPFSIVLFDEIEKAHHKIYDILLQIIEDGILTDNNGITFSFKNSIIVMTSNIGFTNNQRGSKIGFSIDNKVQCCYNKDNLFNELKYTFRPEFLNRIDTISTFDYLTKESIVTIANKMINEIVQQIYDDKQIQVLITDETRFKIYEEGLTTEYGARPLRRAINNLIIDPVCEIILTNGEVEMKNKWITI